ncbi:MAG: VOC family protein [Caulobacteraceae bacterium]|nr:VOC family protein [Caulobacteraceae bacterium]
MITDLDHIALAVADFEARVADYEALLGRAADHTQPSGGARRAWFRLQNTAIEIIAADSEGPAGDRVRARLAEGGDGLLAIAFRTPDLERAAHGLGRRGLATTPSENGEALFADPAATGGLPLVFVSADNTQPPSPPTGDPAACAASLDHIVIQTPNPDRAAALYGARLGLDLRLDRANPAWGTRLLFFRCGASVVEIGHGLAGGVSDAPDSFGGLAWRFPDPAAAQARLAAAGFNVSEVRKGRKPGTQIFTVRDRTAGVPTLALSATSD